MAPLKNIVCIVVMMSLFIDFFCLNLLTSMPHDSHDHLCLNLSDGCVFVAAIGCSKLPEVAVFVMHGDACQGESMH